MSRAPPRYGRGGWIALPEQGLETMGWVLRLVGERGDIVGAGCASRARIIGQTEDEGALCHMLIFFGKPLPKKTKGGDDSCKEGRRSPK